jgi:hypothetical protein
MNLTRLTNNELWERYTDAAQAWAYDPGDIAMKRTLDAIENEILRRFRDAAEKK